VRLTSIPSLPALVLGQPRAVLFAGRHDPDYSLTTRQYARLVACSVSGIGLGPLKPATHLWPSLWYRRDEEDRFPTEPPIVQGQNAA